MNISQIHTILSEYAKREAPQSSQKMLVTAIPAFCEALENSRLLETPIVTKDWIFQVRKLVSDAQFSSQGFLSSLIGAFVSGIAQGIRNKEGDPEYESFGLTGDLLIKAQTGHLTPAELFEKAPQVVMPFKVF